MWIASLPLLLNNGFLVVYQTDHRSRLSGHSNEKLTQYPVSLGMSLVHMLMHQRSSPQRERPSRKLSQLFHACTSARGEPSGSEAIGTAAQRRTTVEVEVTCKTRPAAQCNGEVNSKRRCCRRNWGMSVTRRCGEAEEISAA